MKKALLQITIQKFESMVDSLIGDSATEIPRYYKEQRDGKL